MNICFTLGRHHRAARKFFPNRSPIYRVHDANGFYTSVNDPRRERIKQQYSPRNFWRSAWRTSPRIWNRPRVCDEITGITRREADRLRLVLDGGWPWETVKTEWGIYQVSHPAFATFKNRAFKTFPLLPALAIPPKAYYAIATKTHAEQPLPPRPKSLAARVRDAHVEKNTGRRAVMSISRLNTTIGTRKFSTRRRKATTQKARGTSW